MGMDSERPLATAEAAARLADIDIRQPAAELQPASSNPPSTARGSVVRELPRATPQVEQSAIVKHSEEHIGDVFAALAAAQGQFGEIERTLTAKIKSERADYTYDYAPLDEVLQAVRPALSANGLSLMQFPFAVNGAVTVRTLLGHSSGGWFFNDLRVTSDDNSPRAIGSAITYARRYALMSMLGVAPAVDDDGGAAGPKADPPRAGQRRSDQVPSQASSAAPPAAASNVPPVGAPAGTARQSSGRAAVRPKPADRSAQPPAPQDRPAPPAEPPAASQPASGDASPEQVGRIVEMQDKPNGAIVVLETGFRAASKEEQTTKDLKHFKSMNATVKLTTRPSSDPSRFAPVIVKVELVKRETREPGEEG